MPRQHEPPAPETEAASSVAVRRAVPVPAPGADPGAELGPRTPDTPDAPAAPEPALPPSASAPRRFLNRRARSAAAEEPASASSTSAAAEPDADSDLGEVSAGNGDGADTAVAAATTQPDEPDESPPGRPRSPMLAAAGIAGALLIAVPFLVLAMAGDDEDRPANTAAIGGTTLDPGTSDDQAVTDYTAASPLESPNASPKASKAAPLKSTGAEKEAPPAYREKKEGAAEPKKATAPTARERANAASSQSSVLLKNAATGKCADLPSFGKGSVGGPVRQYACADTNSDNQLWDLDVADSKGGPGGASLFVVKNTKDGLCMELPGSGTVESGTKVSERRCDNTTSDNQLWYLTPRPGGTYWLRNRVGNLCLGVSGGKSAGDDARLQVWECGDDAVTAQRWSFS